jgi:hypothetical protein
MGKLVPVSVCCGPRLKDNHFFFTQALSLTEVIITSEEHGLAKVPHVTLYDLTGHEFEAEIQVDDETFDVIIRQEAPAIPFYIALN